MKLDEIRKLKDYYVKQGIEEGKIYTILPGFSMDDFEFIVMYAGNFNEYQGIDMLIEVAKKCPHMTFILIGEKKGECPDLPNVEYKGYISGKEYFRLLRIADVLIIPRKDIQPNQTLPGKLADYQMSNAFLVATDVCDLKDFADHLCEPNVDSIVKELEDIYLPSYNVMMYSDFNIDNVVDKILEVINKI